MYEVELTAIVKNKAEVLKKLAEYAKKPAHKVIYDDLYFDKNNELDERDCELRLRKKTFPASGKMTHWLTLKEAPFDQKTRSKPEFETEITDFESTQAIFKGLGYTLDIRYNKNCQFFYVTYREIQIEISLVELPELTETFIEIETQTEQLNQTDALFKILYTFLEEIGISPNDLTTIQYQDAVRESRKENN
ncbi:MAG TPA: class IV adenylate cyclase [Leeuwenhoekiella sp.]|nr:class IV adenylate cyclase [Leeuwenhoekiella sp.]